MKFLDRLLTKRGEAALERVNYFAGVCTLLVYALREIFRRGMGDVTSIYRSTVMQIYFTAVVTLKLVGTIALFLGAAVIVNVINILPGFGAGDLAGILIAVIVRELGPLLTAIIIVARSGAAISTQIGNMMVMHEVEALDSMGIDPLRLIVLPRILGMVISLTALILYFDLIGIVGGVLVSKLVAPTLVVSDFFRIFFQKLTVADLLVGLVKGILFGFFVSVISVYHGFKSYHAITEVPLGTTRAVVSNFFVIFVINAVVSGLFYI